MQFQFTAFEEVVFDFFRAHPDTAFTMFEVTAYVLISPKPAYPLDFRKWTDHLVRIGASKMYTSLLIDQAVRNLVDWKLVKEAKIKQVPQDRRYSKRSETYYTLAR